MKKKQNKFIENRVGLHNETWIPPSPPFSWLRKWSNIEFDVTLLSLVFSSFFVGSRMLFSIYDLRYIHISEVPILYKTIFSSLFGFLFNHFNDIWLFVFLLRFLCCLAYLVIQVQ